MKEEKDGLISEVIFYNEINYYAVLLFETSKEQFFAVGTIFNPKKGQKLKLLGEWKTHPKFGEQFSFTAAEELKPTTNDGIINFLSSGIIPGIGPAAAKNIVDCFGKDTLDIIENNPQKLLLVHGIGKVKAKIIHEGYKEHKDYANTILKLGSLDIPIPTCIRLYKTYGNKAFDVVLKNPYKLIEDVYSIGFLKADKIARSIGIKENSEERLNNGVMYLFSEFQRSGNSYYPEKELLENCANFLNVSMEDISQAVDSLCFQGKLFKDNIEGQNIYALDYLYKAEKYIASKLYILSSETPEPISYDPSFLIREQEIKTGVILSKKQKKAVLEAINNSVQIITGGPGTGKTTIINQILDIFHKEGLKVALAAPTGKAAKRMESACKHPAFTLHRLLEYNFIDEQNKMIFGRNEENPLNFDCIIVDELSMVDVLLMEALLKAIKPKTRLILVGDSDQLPSIGAGNVLKDMLSSDLIPSIKLTDIFRQSLESNIIVNAYLINKGEYPSFNSKDGDCFFLQRNKEEDIKSAISDLCSKRLTSYFKDVDPFDGIQVLTPTKKGPLGSISLNNMLQSVLNPKAPGKKEKLFKERVLREGDKVMQTKNDYEITWTNTFDFSKGFGIFNGDLGIIKSINTEDDIICVIFDNEKLVEYNSDNFEELELAYALTVHKSQGCEFPIIVMPISKFPDMLSTRNLLYTALTRAKTGAVFVGNQNMLNAMVDNNKTQTRYSSLEYRLKTIWGIYDSF